MHLQLSSLYRRILLGAVPIVLASCASSIVGKGGWNASGEPDGPWVVYSRRYRNEPYRVYAKGNLKDGELAGVWTKWWHSYGPESRMEFQGTFEGGLPRGQFTIGRIANADTPDLVYQYVDGEVSGTMEGLLYGDEFNVEVRVRYVAEAGKIISVLAGERRYAQKHLKGLKDSTEFRMNFLKDIIQDAVRHPIAPSAVPQLPIVH
jgi:hypothetical protein